MTYELYHFGVLGMRWGVRRYQNKDGTLTRAGRKHKANETSNQRLSKYKAKQINQVFSTMDELDRKKLAVRGDKIIDDEWARNEVVYSFISKHEKTPVSFLYMQGPEKWSRDTSANIVVGTDPKYRKQGLSSNAVEKGIEWFNNNPSLSTLEWRAFSYNTESINLAKKYGFTLDKSRMWYDDDLVFTIQKDKRSTRRAEKLANKRHKAEIREWKREHRKKKTHT